MFNFKDWFHGLINQKEEANEKENVYPNYAADVLSVPSSARQCLDNNHNDFALALYKQLLERRGNLFFSPFSVRVACAMACAGARDETAVEMNSALRFTSAGANNQAEFVELIQRVNTDDKEYEMSSANALWNQTGAQLEPEFAETMTREFNGYVNAVNFSGGDFEAARSDINGWVKQKTNQRINEIIPAGAVDADTRLVLVNAVYFKGLWLDPFDKVETRDEPFYPEEGAPMEVPLMYQTTHLRYVQATGFKAVELNYKGGDMSMLVLLPENNSLRDFEAKLSAGLLDDELKNMPLCEVELYLPRFKITWGADLSSQLSALGMPLAFNPDSADFSGINGYKPPHEESLHVSNVLHQAMVEVNEEGAEAAAATLDVLAAFGVSSDEDPVAVFRADRPFLFAICDKKSGGILFIGRMENPVCGN